MENTINTDNDSVTDTDTNTDTDTDNNIDIDTDTNTNTDTDTNTETNTNTDTDTSTVGSLESELRNFSGGKTSAWPLEEVSGSSFSKCTVLSVVDWSCSQGPRGLSADKCSLGFFEGSNSVFIRVRGAIEGVPCPNQLLDKILK